MSRGTALPPLLLLAIVPSFLMPGTASCSKPPQTPIYKIYEYCRKDKTGETVVAKLQQLGLDLDKEDSKYYEPKSRTDYKYVRVTLNPQTEKNIQGFFITWKKDLGGLTYEEIQQMAGITLPKRGAKELQVSESSGNETRFYVTNHESLHHPDSQVTVVCERNNYDKCWQIDIDCFEFVHPE